MNIRGALKRIFNKPAQKKPAFDWLRDTQRFDYLAIKYMLASEKEKGAILNEMDAFLRRTLDTYGADQNAVKWVAEQRYEFFASKK